MLYFFRESYITNGCMCRFRSMHFSCNDWLTCCSRFLHFLSWEVVRPTLLSPCALKSEREVKMDTTEEIVEYFVYDSIDNDSNMALFNLSCFQTSSGLCMNFPSLKVDNYSDPITARQLFTMRKSCVWNNFIQHVVNFKTITTEPAM